MGAKDTVRTYDELKAWCYDKWGVSSPTELDIRHAQAEISLEIGIEQGKAEGIRLFIEHIMNDTQDYDYVHEGERLLGKDVFWKFYEWTQKLGDVSKQAGIREVVGLIDTKEDLVHTGYHGYASRTPNAKCKGCQIEAKLKTWGVGDK